MTACSFPLSQPHGTLPRGGIPCSPRTESPPCGYLLLMLLFAPLVSRVQTVSSDRASDRNKEIVHVKNKYAYVAKSVNLNVSFSPH